MGWSLLDPGWSDRVLSLPWGYLLGPLTCWIESLSLQINMEILPIQGIFDTGSHLEVQELFCDMKWNEMCMATMKWLNDNTIRNCSSWLWYQVILIYQYWSIFLLTIIYRVTYYRRRRIHVTTSEDAGDTASIVKIKIQKETSTNNEGWVDILVIFTTISQYGAHHSSFPVPVYMWYRPCTQYTPATAAIVAGMMTDVTLSPLQIPK